MARGSAVRELGSLNEVVEASGGDLMARWAARRLGRGGRAWECAGSVLVASPAASRRDRLVVVGDAARSAAAVRAALAQLGPAYRPLVDREAAGALLAGLHPGTRADEFSWMDTACAPAGRGGSAAPHRRRRHLRGGRAARCRAPESYAWPGDPDVHRWLGVREEGRLLAVAADAWSGPGVGFLAGVATLPAARGRGIARGLCAEALRRLVERHGAAALMVDDDNEPALAIYRRLGMRLRPVAGLVLPT